MSWLAPDRLGPAERLFNPLAQNQTDRVARMPRGAAVNGGGTAIVVLRDVRGHVEAAHVSDEAAGVEQLVGADGDAVLSRHRADHRRCCFCLGRAACLGDLGLNHQATAVLHHRMAHVAQLGRRTRGLLVTRTTDKG